MVSTPHVSEADLVRRAQQALSVCYWEVGECAALWTKRFARGRTDNDFGNLVGLSGDQVFQRRRVWEVFHDVAANYTTLSWSHYYTALNWDDSADCLQWANDTQASVVEMKAWRRIQRGEDAVAVDESLDVTENDVSAVRIPFEPDGSSSEGGTAKVRAEGAKTMAGVARDAGTDGDYSPFHAGAITAPKEESFEPPSTAQQIRRVTTAMERCHAAITPEFCREFKHSPDKVKARFLKAWELLEDRLAGLT